MFGSTDVIIAAAVNQSVLFALNTGNLAISAMKLGYVRYTENDGTSFTEVISVPLTELASITTAHADNYAKYLDSDTSGGNYFLLRVDFPDAAFVVGKDKVICNIYDDDENVIAHRIFDLTGPDSIYVGGAVWVDPVAGVAGTRSYVNGIPSNPVSNISTARVIAAAMGFKRIRIINGSTPSDMATTSYIGYTIFSDSFAQIDLGSTNVAGVSFEGLRINDGGSTGASGGYCNLKDCFIGKAAGMDIPRMIARDCTLEGIVHLADDGNYLFSGLRTADDDTVLDFNDISPGDPGQNTVLISGFSGRLTIKNMLTTDSIEISGNGEIIFHSSCNSGTATARVSGAIKVTNNATALDLTNNTIDQSNATAISNLQSTVDNMGEFTRIKTSINSHYINPASGSEYTQIWVTLRDLDGDIVDPDSDDLGIELIGTVSGDITARLYDGDGGSPLASASAVVGKKLIKSATGIYYCWLKTTVGDQIENLNFTLGWKEGSPLVTYKEFTGSAILDEVPSTVNANVVEWDGNAVTGDGDWAALAAALAAVKNKTDNLPHSIKKNTAINNFKFVMLSALTGDPMPGLTVAASRSLDNTNFTSMANSVSERGSGVYEIDVAAADTNADTGAWKFMATGAEATIITFITEV